MTDRTASIRTMRGIEGLNSKLDRVLEILDAPATIDTPETDPETETETDPLAPATIDQARAN